MASNRKSSGKKNGRSTKTKAPADNSNVVEMRKASAAPKLNLPEESVILNHMKNVKGIGEKMSTLAGMKSKAYDAAKAAGIPKRVIDDLLKLERSPDPAAVRLGLEVLGVGLKAIGATFQLQIFDTAFGNAEEQAKAEARQAAQSGAAPENRWPEGSKESEAYLAEYQRIQSGMVPGAENLTESELEDARKAGVVSRVIENQSSPMH
jgi:hypothetical protein